MPENMLWVETGNPRFPLRSTQPIAGAAAGIGFGYTRTLHCYSFDQVYADLTGQREPSSLWLDPVTHTATTLGKRIAQALPKGAQQKGKELALKLLETLPKNLTMYGFPHDKDEIISTWRIASLESD